MRPGERKKRRQSERSTTVSITVVMGPENNALSITVGGSGERHVYPSHRGGCAKGKKVVILNEVKNLSGQD
jgi:hypothetical protein